MSLKPAIGRFNRYIVECKGWTVCTNGWRALRFNRYIVECKGLRQVCFWAQFVDLIDTLWNVKVTTSGDSVHESYRFNRYIVECKEEFFGAEKEMEIRFNRYIVECKAVSESTGR